MSVLEELNHVVEEIGPPVETGIFSGTAPDEYVVLTPLSDMFDLFADNMPTMDIGEIRISLFTRGNYTLRVKQFVKKLFTSGFTITDRRYVGYEEDTGYHHYAIDVAKENTSDLEE